MMSCVAENPRRWVLGRLGATYDFPCDSVIAGYVPVRWRAAVNLPVNLETRGEITQGPLFPGVPVV
jgi:hypothetical protein